MRGPGAPGQLPEGPQWARAGLRLLVNGVEEPLCEFPQLRSGRLGLFLQPHVVLAQVLHFRLEDRLVLLLLGREHTGGVRHEPETDGVTHMPGTDRVTHVPDPDHMMHAPNTAPLPKGTARMLPTTQAQG